MASVSQYFYELAEEIPDDKWKDVAHHLGLKRAKVSAIDAENRYLKEKNMKTLEAWRLKNGRNATIPCLKRALHAAEVGWVADSVIDGIREEDLPLKSGIQEETKQENSSCTTSHGATYTRSNITPPFQQQEGALLGMEGDMKQLQIADKHLSSLEQPTSPQSACEKAKRMQGSGVQTVGGPACGVTLQPCSLQFFHQVSQDMLREIERFSKLDDHKDRSCCIVFLMSHGQEGCIMGRDGQRVKLKDIFRLFDNIHCESLLGKPKLFFIQSCRGANVDRGTVPPRDVPDAVGVLKEQTLSRQLFGPMGVGEDVPDAARCVDQPTRTDMFFGYATQEGNMAFRNETQGSWYIQAMDQVFRQHAKDTHVADMMTMVNRLVAAKTAQSENSDYTGGKEASEYLSNLQKNLYFFPGL
ncbi:uncharacterized protein LOC118430471 [Branchiostoma floridae]|uniref:Uncharacterized protein LOC118430471 n=1 Tax=Branchiostoma floridae TaxID=7739 RepID=A0A9J7MA85_BRAFL|nr:uncharacterized protein LOC118430471 [Branchiostoma floridae]